MRASNNSTRGREKRHQTHQDASFSMERLSDAGRTSTPQWARPQHPISAHGGTIGRIAQDEPFEGSRVIAGTPQHSVGQHRVGFGVVLAAAVWPVVPLDVPRGIDREPVDSGPLRDGEQLSTFAHARGSVEG